jgi:hypothetical protein
MEGILIPIFGIFMIIAVVLGPIWIRGYFNTREREAMQATLRTALEKGQPLPPEMIAALQQDGPGEIPGTPASDLRRAVVMMATGLGLEGLAFGLFLGLSAIADERVGWIVGGSVGGAGAIPFMIGLAYLFLYFVNRNRTPATR